MPTRREHNRRIGARWLMGVLGASLVAAAPVATPDGPDGPHEPADTTTPAPAIEPGAVGADHVVTMGAVDPAIAPTDAPPASEGRTDRFEYLAYYPGTIQVHQGDVIWFEWDGFHTVTFFPEDEPLRGLFRRDEVEGVSAIDGELPSHASCGNQDQDPCPFTGDEYFNTGWSPSGGSTAVTVDAPVGAYTYRCTLHPGMTGTIDVVEEDESVASPDEVEQARQEAIAADTARAEARLEANQTATFETVGDHRRWFVKAGDVTADGRVAILRFMPSDLEIAPGDEVEYVAAGLDGPAPGDDEQASEVHTVTFPDDSINSALGVARYLLPSCDPDDPEAGLPGVQVTQAGFFTRCPDDFTFEYVMAPNAWQQPTRPPGGEVVPGSAYDSGMLAAEGTPCRFGCDPWTEEPFPSTTPANFPAEGTYSYVCLVHPLQGMAGAVRVVEP